MSEDKVSLTLEQVRELAWRAAEACGASSENACSLAASIEAAEAEGLRNVGLAHLPDYCEGMLAGRIDGTAVAVLDRPAQTVFRSDARSGLAHPGFDAVYKDLVAEARQSGVAIFSQRNGYTCGALGYFVSRLAGDGLLALAATNAGPAAVVVPGAAEPVFGTNPLAFSVPGADGPALIIDQSSSATALVNIRATEEKGESLPPGWAVDGQGTPTCDPRAALAGALLPFGGYKGANIAMLVEMLAAGLTGANWSCDAPSFAAGEHCPDTGLFVLAINPAQVFGPDFETRISSWLQRFTDQFGGRIPGTSRLDMKQDSRSGVWVEAELIRRINGYVTG